MFGWLSMNSALARVGTTSWNFGIILLMITANRNKRSLYSFATGADLADAHQYDANLLQAYADDLYIQAQFIVFTTALRYGLMTLFFLGLISGVAIEIFVLSMPPRYPSSALQFKQSGPLP